MKRILVFAVAFGLVAGAVGTALAHEQSKYDGDDANGPLDMIWVEFYNGHGSNNWSNPERIWLCASTQRKWYTRELKRNGSMSFRLDVRGDKASEFYVRFRARDGDLGGALVNARTGNIRWIPGYRYNNKRGACVYFQRKFIAPVKNFVRYSAATGYMTRRECSNFCLDLSGNYRHYM